MRRHSITAVVKGLGELDLYIVKPVSLQFYVTMRRLDFTFFLPDFLAGIALIVTGWRRAGLPFDLVSVGGFLLFLSAAAC